MIDNIRVGRPNPTDPQRPMSAQGYQNMASPKKNSKMLWLIIFLVVIVLAGSGVFLFRDKIFKSDSQVKGATTSKVSDYQAVFLTNGQVYFGKISDKKADYVKLVDIFYLQVTQPPLQGSQQQQAQSQQQPQVSLVKLGKELHGPQDLMEINRQQILFIENMMEDASVVKAIKEYKTNPDAGKSGSPSSAPSSQNNLTPSSSLQSPGQTPPQATESMPAVPANTTPPPLPGQ